MNSDPRMEALQLVFAATVGGVIVVWFFINSDGISGLGTILALAFSVGLFSVITYYLLPVLIVIYAVAVGAATGLIGEGEGASRAILTHVVAVCFFGIICGVAVHILNSMGGGGEEWRCYGRAGCW